MDRLAAAEVRLAAALDRLEAAGLTAPPPGAVVDTEVHEALIAEYDRLNRDLDQLALTLEESRNDNRMLESRLAELAAENAALRDTGAPPAVETAEAPADLERRLADAEAFADEALAELDIARKEMADLRAALARAEQASAQRQADLFRAEADKEAAAKRLDQTIGRLDRAIAG
ncbi:MAG: hypothetical protein PHS60_15275 [Zavarzinia sp.]|nr:hypothetical protein [Zavarzinia sp.]